MCRILCTCIVYSKSFVEQLVKLLIPKVNYKPVKALKQTFFTYFVKFVRHFKCLKMLQCHLLKLKIKLSNSGDG